VNYKIEGFFDICCQEGLSGSQGVVIPWQNVQHLMLREDVIQAVADGKFHIYSIKHVKEALELFMDLDSKKMDKAIIKKLEHFIKIAREYRKET